MSESPAEQAGIEHLSAIWAQVHSTLTAETQWRLAMLCLSRSIPRRSIGRRRSNADLASSKQAERVRRRNKASDYSAGPGAAVNEFGLRPKQSDREACR